MDFVSLIKTIIDQNVRFDLCYGVVTAVNVTPAYVSVKLAGSTVATTNVRYLASYTPVVDDVVVCLIKKGDVLILGDLAV